MPHHRLSKRCADDWAPQSSIDAFAAAEEEEAVAQRALLLEEQRQRAMAAAKGKPRHQKAPSLPPRDAREEFQGNRDEDFKLGV